MVHWLMTRLTAAIVGLVLTCLAIGCGGDDSGGTAQSGEVAEERDAAANESSGSPSTGDERAKPAGKERDGTVVKLDSSPVGDALFDGDDQAIYLFDLETSDEPECYGDCAAAWPPVLSKGRPVAEGPVKQDLLGTTRRDDGSTQVTYNGHPLYYYAHEGPGELVCHNVFEFGGLWLALDESGDALS